jgi:glycerol-3-phosphate dehydrogenase
VYAASRLIYRHGTRADGLLRDHGSDESATLVCHTEPVTEAELRHAIRHEHVHDLSDLRRRVRLAAGPCQGLDCAAHAASILGEERGWSPAQIQDELRRFRASLWQHKAEALSAESWAQEELHASIAGWGLRAGG